MPQYSDMFRAMIVALTANQLTAINPPMGVQNANILNTTNGDVQLHSADAGSEYLTIATQFERPVPNARRVYSPDKTAFWLKSTVGGSVTILWY
jgi:hypothetical protein